MKLYIVRHAIAEERGGRWPDDSQRPLSEEGVRKYVEAARGAKSLLNAPDRVLSSPYVRAWQTAEILAGHAGWPDLERCDEFAGHATAHQTAELIEELELDDAGTVALVGHEPNCSSLTTLLTGSHEIDWFKKGAIAVLEQTADGWSLEDYFPPRRLRAGAS